MKKQHLYFIAMVPPEALAEKIKKIKLNFKEEYHSEKALRLPAHVTLQIPFNLAEEQEELLEEKLHFIAQQRETFQIKLMGFGKFSTRSIFIEVKNPAPVAALNDTIQTSLDEEFGLKNHEKTSSIHPHITIATRDLSKQNFQKAWPEFKGKRFDAEFIGDSFILYKHNGKVWENLRRFKLSFENI